MTAAEKLVPFGASGEMLTIKQISERTGLSAQTLYVRVQRGTPLDAPKFCHKQRDDRIYGNITNDKLRYEEDRVAQAVNSYLREGELLITVEEIAQIFGCSLRGAAKIHDWFRQLVFSGDTTYEVVGDVFGISRQAVKQIQDRNLAAHPELRELYEDSLELQSMRKEHPLDAVPVWGSSVGELTAFPKPNGGRRR